MTPREADELRRIVTATCADCGLERDIEAGEVPTGETPICYQCHGPMFAKRAALRPAAAKKRKRPPAPAEKKRI
jgi:hypothetical protein